MLVRVRGRDSGTLERESTPASPGRVRSGGHMPPRFIANPAFEVPAAAIKGLAAAVKAGVRSPAPPPRPLIILSGYHSPIIPALTLASLLRTFGAASRSNTLAISYLGSRRVETAAERAMAAITRRGWNHEPVDVVGISMGGIVARLLAADHGLKVQRLFTLASPHQGAIITRWIKPDPAAYELAPGSPLLTRLDTCLPASIPELTCYALLRDWLVGAQQTAPAGHTSLWLDVDRIIARPISHFSITSDRRIVGDLALRLMNQTPWSSPGMPPPIQ
jgi:pimeloyl-ACP methyl ester carboxylesterase